MNIKTLLVNLELADPNLPVYFDFCSCVPVNINSWRGVYAEPAIGWQPTGYSGDGEEITVEQFIEVLKHAAYSGAYYLGWKGGEYIYNENSELHVDNPGDCTHTDISHIEINDYRVIICTKSMY